MTDTTKISSKHVIEAAHRMVAGNLKQAAAIRQSVVNAKKTNKDSKLRIAECRVRLAEID
jgi:hypothetical protein